MDRISLRKERQRWQRSRKPSFSLRQEGQFSSQEKISAPQIKKYVGVSSGKHFAENSKNLTNVNDGTLRTGDTVLIWGDRLIGQSRGRQIF